MAEPRPPHAVELTETAQATFAKSHIAFALGAYSKFVAFAPTANLVFSPLNIQLAMGMTLSGAEGRERSELARAMAQEVDADAIEAALQSWVAALLNARTETASGVRHVDARLRLANAIWLDSKLSVNPLFLHRVTSHYGPALYRAPIVGGAPEVAVDINSWVSEMTFGRIPHFIDSLMGEPLAIFVSAAYLKAPFLTRFSDTYKERFFVGPDRDAQVDYMQAILSLRVSRSKEYQAFELPLAYGNTAIVSIMPQTKSLAEFMRSLTVAKWSAIQVALRAPARRADLRWPKFSIRSRVPSLRSLLGWPNCELKLAFAGQNPEVGNVVHEATIATNQDGLEAAAATAVEIVPVSWSESELAPPIVIKFDHPFLFAVVDKTTGAILFIGQFTSL